MVDPATRRTRRGGQHVDERGGVVVGDLLALVDLLDRERRRPDRVELVGGRARRAPRTRPPRPGASPRSARGRTRPRPAPDGCSAGSSASRLPRDCSRTDDDEPATTPATGKRRSASSRRSTARRRPTASAAAPSLIAARLRRARMPGHDRGGTRPRRLLVADRPRQRGRGRGRRPRAAQTRSDADACARRGRSPASARPPCGTTSATAGAGSGARCCRTGRRGTWWRRSGDPDAERTFVLIAHHDAAHSGLIFHPILPRIPLKLAPRLHARAGRSFPLLYTVWIGPVMVCAGSILGVRRAARRRRRRSPARPPRRWRTSGRRAVVPGRQRQPERGRGLVGLAAALRDRPLEGARVLLVSTGSEESFSEGMQGFGERHFDELDPERTEMVCLECLGGPTLIVVEGEGMLRMRDYPVHMREALAGRGRRRRADHAWAADDGRHRRDHPAARRLCRGHARVGRRDEAPDELPLAERRRRQPALVDDRERDRGVRPVPAHTRAAARWSGLT